MKKLSQIAAVLALGSACALPVMAQDTSTSGTQGGSATTQSVATAPDSASTSTQTMGAGPSDMDAGTHRDNDRDLGWLGLLGLAGLLGLRRKHHDHHDNYNRTTTAR